MFLISAEIECVWGRSSVLVSICVLLMLCFNNEDAGASTEAFQRRALEQWNKMECKLCLQGRQSL